MNPNKQNLAIAEACRWTCPNCSQPVRVCTGCDFQDYPDRCIPNYCNDLNAMHEAQKTLTSNQHIDYAREIARSIFDDKTADEFTPRVSWACISVFVSTNAAQRAEAFLRTLNLWVD